MARKSMKAAGRPPEPSTKNGKSMLRFDVPVDVAEQIRDRAALDRRELGPFLAQTICTALGLTLPPPAKRGPKPKV